MVGKVVDQTLGDAAVLGDTSVVGDSVEVGESTRPVIEEFEKDEVRESKPQQHSTLDAYDTFFIFEPVLSHKFPQDIDDYENSKPLGVSFDATGPITPVPRRKWAKPIQDDWSIMMAELEILRGQFFNRVFFNPDLNFFNS